MKTNILLPIGLSDFAELMHYRNDDGDKYAFVDKSMLIKSFLHTGERVSVITRPRRFGKSLNLSMLEHFFAPQVYRVKTKGLFEGLKISQYPNAMAYQGKSPAIFLTLKAVKGGSYEVFYTGMRGQIADLFQKHKRYALHARVTEAEKELYEDIIDEKAAPHHYEKSLLFLSRLLYEASGQKVYLFLDEYDTPIHDAYIEGYYKPCTQLMARLFNNTFKGNPYLAKAMITGILKVAKASLFSDLNNVKVYSMLSDDLYAEYFGFTEKETNDLLDLAGLPTEAHQLKEMYNGYEVNGITLYNPWSILNFIVSALRKPLDRIQEAMRPYWVNTGGTDILLDLLRNNLAAVQKDMAELVQGRPIETRINEEVRFTPQLRENATAFWSLMLLSGYLKVLDKSNPRGRFFRCILSFPNEEIRETFEDLSMEAAVKNIDYVDELMDACQNLVEGNVEAFTQYVDKYIKTAGSFHDAQGVHKEQFFHGLILGMTACLTPTHDIRSNRESGQGRYDIAITPKHSQPLGVLIEIKAAPDQKSNLKKLAQVAAAQITTRQYYQEMKQQGVPQIISVGMAFHQKQVAVVSQSVSLA